MVGWLNVPLDQEYGDDAGLISFADRNCDSRVALLARSVATDRTNRATGALTLIKKYILVFINTYIYKAVLCVYCKEKS